MMTRFPIKNKLAAAMLATAAFTTVPAFAQVRVWESEEEPSARHLSVFGFVQPRVQWTKETTPGSVVDDQQFGALMRRVRFGIEPSVSSWLTAKVEFDFGDGHGSGHLIDAYAVVKVSRAFRLDAGHFRVPISRQNLISSRKWQLVDPAVFVGAAHSIDREDGVMASGRFFAGKLGYMVGVFNGDGLTESRGRMDDYPMVAARLEVSPLGPLPHFESDVRKPEQRRRGLVGFGASVARDCLQQRGQGRTYASGDFSSYWRGMSLLAEAFFRRDTTADVADSLGATYVAGLFGSCSRRGTPERDAQKLRDVIGYNVQVGAFVPGQYGHRHVEIVGRHQYFDPQRDAHAMQHQEELAASQDPRDQATGFWSLGLGINWFINGLRPDTERAGEGHNAKVQVAYEHRTTLDKCLSPGAPCKASVKNDQVLLQLTAGF